MKREQDKQSILNTMEENLSKDEKRTKIIGFTELGILQLTRKKTKITLSEALKVKCTVCEGTGRMLSPETVAFRLERDLFEHRQADFEAILIETTPEVREALLGENETHRGTLEELLHIKLYFTIQPSLPHYYQIKQFGSSDELATKETASI
jgi:ribonuclease G